MQVEKALAQEDLSAQVQAGLRDIVALSTMPALWLGAQPLRIAEILAASLYTMLDARFIFVSFSGAAGGPPIAVAQTGRHETDRALADAIAPATLAWAQAHDPDDLLRLPMRDGQVRLATRQLGLNGRFGVLAAAFPDDGPAPTAFHHLLLNVAACQATTAVQNAHLLRALRDSIDERERSVRALGESEARFRGMADSAPVMVWMTDQTGACTFRSRSWSEFIGGAQEEAVGSGWLEAVHPADREAVQASYAAASRVREPYRVEYRVRRADGDYRWALDSAQPRLGPDGEFLGHIGSVLDISDRKSAELALAAQAEDLHRSNVELEQFAYVAAHDLQEPLRTISLNTDLLLRKVPEAVAAVHGRRIQAAADRMRTLLSDLLAYSRVIHGADEEPLTADLGQAAGAAVQSLEDLIARTGAVVAVEDLPRVRMTAAHAALVFQNLISNALKYQAPGRVPEVRLAARRDRDAWLVAVRDNGIGFDPIHAERIFGLFKRLHGSSYPGTGLGLAICRRIVERSGGRIWAESAGEGAGAVFTMSMPAAEAG